MVLTTFMYLLQAYEDHSFNNLCQILVLTAAMSNESAVVSDAGKNVARTSIFKRKKK